MRSGFPPVKSFWVFLFCCLIVALGFAIHPKKKQKTKQTTYPGLPRLNPQILSKIVWLHEGHPEHSSLREPRICRERWSKFQGARKRVLSLGATTQRHSLLWPLKGSGVGPRNPDEKTWENSFC